MIGVVIVGHGSRVAETKEVYEAIANETASKSSFEVRVGYMKHWRPTLKEAVDELVRKGIKKIVIVPLFLLPGLHVRNDIPVLLGLKEGELPEFGYEKVEVPEDVKIFYARNIGADERLIDVVLDRVREVV